MFQLHVGSTPCELSPRDYRSLADKTNGCVLSLRPRCGINKLRKIRYSGSDIAIVVRDALMQPIRKVISAEHFKQVQDPNNANAIKWTPCSPGDPEAVEKSWANVESDELLEPPLKLGDFLKSLATVRPTVTDGDVRRHEQWTMDSGVSSQQPIFLPLMFYCGIVKEMTAHDHIHQT
jgi:vacuolar protein-sorting-associated protein 4